MIGQRDLVGKGTVGEVAGGSARMPKMMTGTQGAQANRPTAAPQQAEPQQAAPQAQQGTPDLNNMANIAKGLKETMQSINNNSKQAEPQQQPAVPAQPQTDVATQPEDPFDPKKYRDRVSERRAKISPLNNMPQATPANAPMEPMPAPANEKPIVGA